MTGQSIYLKCLSLFAPGDVVRLFSPIAGKAKFHLCICLTADGLQNYFLYVNSEGGYKGDYVMDDGVIPGLPESRTGQTVVSFTQLVRVNAEKLELFQAKKTGEVDHKVFGELIGFAKSTSALSSIDRKLILAALDV